MYWYGCSVDFQTWTISMGQVTCSAFTAKHVRRTIQILTKTSKTTYLQQLEPISVHFNIYSSYPFYLFFQLCVQILLWQASSVSVVIYWLLPRHEGRPWFSNISNSHRVSSLQYQGLRKTCVSRYFCWISKTWQLGNSVTPYSNIPSISSRPNIGN